MRLRWAASIPFKFTTRSPTRRPQRSALLPGDIDVMTNWPESSTPRAKRHKKAKYFHCLGNVDFPTVLPKEAWSYAFLSLFISWSWPTSDACSRVNDRWYQMAKKPMLIETKKKLPPNAQFIRRTLSPLHRVWHPYKSG